VRILLLTGHEPTRQALAHGLQREGFTVVTATTPKDADSDLRGADPAAVLLDLAVPGSLALLGRWRDRGPTAYLLALVGRTTRLDDRVRSLEIGADGYLTKPVQVPDLVARLRALERRGRTPTDPVLRIRDLVINTATRTVERGGNTIPLTRREYALLRFLVMNRGRIVSQATIRDSLYRDDDRSNVITVYIHYLRQKIDKGFDTPLIETRWGQGYLMRGDA
jgi:DNA-binding response OmpR family regulator